MDFLAKHFFDYQSFVNLPHKAVQLHKTPPSQAGVDPSAGWAPKSYHLSGRNQAAPQARPNRNHVEARPGGHKHGRPSKLEFRTWGDRHGELHIEKTVPHKDAWMASLDGDFKHFYEKAEEGMKLSSADSVDHFAGEYFPKLQSRFLFSGQEGQGIEKAWASAPVELLTILTLANHMEFVTVTVKMLRGISHLQDPYVKVQLFEGIQMMEERRSTHSTDGANHRTAATIGGMKVAEDGREKKERSTPPTPKRTDLVSSPSLTTMRTSSATGRRPLRMAQSQHPHQYTYHSNALQHLRRSDLPLGNPRPETVNHNGGPASSLGAPPRRNTSPKKNTALSRTSSLGTSSSTRSEESHNKEQVEESADISESFLMHVHPTRLNQSHILMQVFVRRTQETEQGNEENVELEEAKEGEEERANETLIGACVLGPLSAGRGRLHWRQMMRKQGSPVCMWHLVGRTPAGAQPKVRDTKKAEEEAEHSLAQPPVSVEVEGNGTGEQAQGEQQEEYAGL